MVLVIISLLFILASACSYMAVQHAVSASTPTAYRSSVSPAAACFMCMSTRFGGCNNSDATYMHETHLRAVITDCNSCTGSTQEEMGALVQQSINDSKISGGDRPVAWDGETRSGAGLQNQLKQIQDSKVRFA